MDVGRVIVLVLDAIVAMRVCVLADDRRIVRVGVVIVIVAMNVVVLDRLVDVPVPMPFAEVQVHAEAEQRGCCDRE